MHALLLFLLFDRRPGGESDTESSRETSSDGSSDYRAERGVNNGVQGPGAETDAGSSRETSSDGSSNYRAKRGVDNGVQGPWTQQTITDANIQSLNRISLRNKPVGGSSSDEYEISNPPGRLIFEYMEHAPPFTREPLADKASS